MLEFELVIRDLKNATFRIHDGWTVEPPVTWPVEDVNAEGDLGDVVRPVAS